MKKKDEAYVGKEIANCVLCRNHEFLKSKLVELDCGHYAHGLCAGNQLMRFQHCPNCKKSIGLATQNKLANQYEKDNKIPVNSEVCYICKKGNEVKELTCHHFVHGTCLKNYIEKNLDVPLSSCPQCIVENERDVEYQEKKKNFLDNFKKTIFRHHTYKKTKSNLPIIVLDDE